MTAAAPEWKALLGEAAEWHLLSVLFSRPQGAWRDRLRALADEVPDAALRRMAAAALGQANEGAYLTLLGPGGDVSPREAGHREVSDPGRVLADVSAYYESFAWQPAGEDPLDHVATEAGFVAYLKLKEAFALRGGDTDAADVTREAASGFRDTHLAMFVEPLAKGLEAAGAEYLAEAGAALLARVGPRPESAAGGWVPEGLEGCGFGCAALGDGVEDASGFD